VVLHDYALHKSTFTLLYFTSSKSMHFHTDRQTDRQTDKRTQTCGRKHVPPTLSEVNYKYNFSHRRSILNTKLKSTVLYGYYRSAYVAVWRHVVEATFVEIIFVCVDDLWTVELVQEGQQGSSVPVVRHSSTVVALSRQVRHSNVLNILYQTRQASGNDCDNDNKSNNENDYSDHCCLSVVCSVCEQDNSQTCLRMSTKKMAGKGKGRPSTSD